MNNINAICGIFILCLFLYLLTRIVSRTNRRQMEQETERIRRMLRRAQSNSNKMSKKDMEKRRDLIRKSLVIKTVPSPSEECDEEAPHIQFPISSANIRHSASKTQLKQSNHSIIDLAVDTTLKSTSKTQLKRSNHSIIDLSVDTSGTTVESTEKGDSETLSTNDTLNAPSGGNIVSGAIRSITSIMAWQPKSSNFDDDKVCPICLEPYKVGEEVCYSTNQECSHSFHLGCMMKWLMAHDDCPLCRIDYLNLEKKNEENRSS